MVLQEGGDGTLWMNQQESTATNSIQYDYLSLKNKTKDELIGNIKRSGVDMYVVRGRG